MLGHSFTLLLQYSNFHMQSEECVGLGGEGESSETVIVIKNSSSCKHAKGTEIKLLMQLAVIIS